MVRAHFQPSFLAYCDVRNSSPMVSHHVLFCEYCALKLWAEINPFPFKLLLSGPLSLRQKLIQATFYKRKERLLGYSGGGEGQRDYIHSVGFEQEADRKFKHHWTSAIVQMENCPSTRRWSSVGKKHGPKGCVKMRGQPGRWTAVLWRSAAQQGNFPLLSVWEALWTQGGLS